MNKIDKSLFFALLFLILCLIVMFTINTKVEQEKNRYKANYETMEMECQTYRTKDSLSVISVGQLELKKKELENANAELVKTCKELNIKLKRIESASETSGATTIIKEIPIHDTIVRVDTSFVKYQSFIYQDKWNTIEGYIKDSKVNCKIVVRDTLRQVLYRIPHKFLFFKFGTKEYKQECITSNPYNNLVYSQYIKIK